jgi:hypothetical protein
LHQPSRQPKAGVPTASPPVPRPWLRKLAAWLGRPVVLFSSITTTVTLISVAAQFTYTAHPDVQFGPAPQDKYFWLSLWQLDQRAGQLADIKDPIARDERCIPTAMMARRLNERPPADTRIFVNGVVGTSNSARETTYFFLRNYLFPRDVEISLDGKAAQTLEGFSGVPCESRDELRTNGFDVLIRFQTNNTIAVSPLTPKGILK